MLLSDSTLSFQLSKQRNSESKLAQIPQQSEFTHAYLLAAGRAPLTLTEIDKRASRRLALHNGIVLVFLQLVQVAVVVVVAAAAVVVVVVVVVEVVV